MAGLYDFNSSLDWSNPFDSSLGSNTDAGSNPGAFDPFALVGPGMMDYASQQGQNFNSLMDTTTESGSDGNSRGDAFNNWFKNNGFSLKSATTPTHQFWQGFSGDTPVGQSVGVTLDDPIFGMAMSSLAAAAGGGLANLGGLGAIGQGAASGGLSSLASTLDPKQGLMGALYGGLGAGVTSQFNPAGRLGIENDYLQKAVNNGLTGGVTAGLRGGDVGQGVLGGAIAPLINYGASQAGLMPQGSLPTLSGGGLEGAPDVGTGSFEFPDGENSVTMGGAPLPSDVMGHMPQSMGGNYTGQEMTTAADNENSPTAKIMSALGLNDTPLANLMPSGGNLGEMAKGLMSIYSWNEQRKRLRDQERALGVGQNGAYAKALRQQLERRDAAGGRRSQYGPREVELQAALAGLASRNAPALAQLGAARAQHTGQGLAALYSGLQKTGALQKLGDLFKPSMTIDPNGYGLTSGGTSLADYGLAGDY